MAVFYIQWLNYIGSSDTFNRIFSLDVLTAMITLVAMELISRKKWYGWAIGLINQPLWVILSIQKEAYGLVILALVLSWRYASALLRWKRQTQ